jgi:hypothetical protein
MSKGMREHGMDYTLPFPLTERSFSLTFYHLAYNYYPISSKGLCVIIIGYVSYTFIQSRHTRHVYGHREEAGRCVYARVRTEMRQAGAPYE